jgi:hypothetical protein
MPQTLKRSPIPWPLTSCPTMRLTSPDLLVGKDATDDEVEF